ncbi:hypothetical protein BGZ58_003563 [Dissophora ornata]|nr:hypothetical protein BGZ58_003563 [Dissophora ornata]
MSPIPEGKLTDETRAQLEAELQQTRNSMAESQVEINAAHASITAFQNLVLTTHDQVGKAKQAVMQARGISPTSPSTMSSGSSSSSASTASSPPSPSSPMSEGLGQDSNSPENLRRLEQEHAELGLRLSQVLRDKAEAEETKKRLSDEVVRARSRIREIEQKLSE